MEDFRGDFYNFVSQMHTKAYRKYKQTDKVQQEREHYLDINREKFQETLNALENKERVFIEEYIDSLTYKESCANESMYIAGYRDCIKILRELEVI